MRQPKHEIGDMFYIAYTFNEGSQHDDVKLFFKVPTICIVKSISINREDVVYTLEEHQATNEGELVREKKYSENSKIFRNLYHSYTDVIKDIITIQTSAFQRLTKTVNKEKLSDILHGK